MTRSLAIAAAAWLVLALAGPGAQALSGSTDPRAPMVSIVNPMAGAVVSPNNQYRVQVRVFNPAAQSGIAGVTSVVLSTDGGTTFPLTATRLTTYDSGSPTVTATVYEVRVTGAAPGSYTLVARASNAAVANVASEPVAVTVVAANTGDGNLLVRDNSSQLCTDCHALPSHSSEAIGTTYGSWATTCRDCHTPHRTRNIMVVKESITPPSIQAPQTAHNVGFVSTAGASAGNGWDTTNARPTPTASFANEGDRSGPCQVCHTRTSDASARTGTNATFTNGSTTVTTAAAVFVSGTAPAGDAGKYIVGPDGKSYLISAVVSATQVTLSAAYTGVTVAGTGYYVVGAARWRNTVNSDTHYTSASGTRSCTGCHSHKSGFAPGESTGGAACSSCHGSTWTAMTGGDATIVSKHGLGAVAGTNDAPADTAASWSGNLSTAVAPASRSCVNMCHVDHVHNAPGQTLANATHANNAHENAATQAARGVTRNADGTIATAATAGSPAKTDFDSASNAGLCVSCHANPVDATKPAIAGATYGASAHDATVTTGAGGATFTWQYRLHDGSTFDRNCTKCHASRTEGTTPSSGGGITAVHGTQDPSLLGGAIRPASASNTAQPAAFVCYNCHGNAATPADGATNANRSNRNVWAATQATYYHPVNLDTAHDGPTEWTAGFASGRFSGANRHANCVDCHNPHAAAGTRTNRTATATSTRNQIAAGSPLTGAPGITFSYATTAVPAACTAGAAIPNACWPATASTNYGASLAAATYEYQVCFKCHTAFAFGSTYPTAPATGASGLAETDLGTEFNPGLVRSGHPAVTGLANYANSPAPKNLNATQLLAPWNVNVGTQTMLCTDCHNQEATAPAVQGPHGSAVRFFLAGTNKAWPYTVAGATSGTPFTVSTSESNLNNANNNGLFCRNCHPQQNSTASNGLHTQIGGSSHASDTAVGACVACHLRIPHGGKVSRLIVTTNAPARYQTVTPNMVRFTKNTAYRSYTVTTNVGTSCAEHSGGASGGESW